MGNTPSTDSQSAVTRQPSIDSEHQPDSGGASPENIPPLDIAPQNLKALAADAAANADIADYAVTRKGKGTMGLRLNDDGSIIGVTKAALNAGMPEGAVIIAVDGRAPQVGGVKGCLTPLAASPDPIYKISVGLAI
jgi:hypothetical protein